MARSYGCLVGPSPRTARVLARWGLAAPRFHRCCAAARRLAPQPAHGPGAPLPWQSDRAPPDARGHARHPVRPSRAGVRGL